MKKIKINAFGNFVVANSSAQILSRINFPTPYWFNDYIKVYKLAVFLVLEMELQLAMSMEQEREQDLTTLVFQVYLGVHQILAPWE